MARPIKYKTKDMIIKAEEYLESSIESKLYFPTIAELSLQIGISRKRLYEISLKSKRLCNTLENIKTLQEQRLQNNGLSKLWDSSMAKFLLSANHGMAEQSIVQNTNINLNTKLSEKEHKLIATATDESTSKSGDGEK